MINCSGFREHHLAFLDNTLSDADLVAMQRHIAECADCARRDTAMRRGLLLFRNLPAIEPSADFAARLNARICQLRQREARLVAAYRGPSLGGFLAVAAGVMTVGVFAASALDWTETPRDIALAPAVVTTPARPSPSPQIVDHTYVLSAAAGVSVWPAVMLAEQVPIQVVNAGVGLASWHP
ncbi:MAG: zf-HC2 domain-containing protein [Gemmatimonadota bacterium]|nr:zf-HC2 domain-containing protein [Gemmatimonadota bacterium]